MRTTLIPALNAAIFIIPYLGCGGLMLIVFNRIFNLNAQLDDLRNFSWVVRWLLAVLGIVILHWSAKFCVMHRKRRSFRFLMSVPAPKTEFMAWAVRIGLPILSLVSAVLLWGVAIYRETLIAWVRIGKEIVSRQVPGFSESLASEAGQLPVLILLMALGILILYGMSWIYAWVRCTKHAPIYRTCTIHGKLNSILGLLWTSAKVKGFGVGVKGEDVVGVPADSIFTETVSSKDWRNKERKQYILAFRERFMPHSTRPVFEEDHLGVILNHLKEALPEGELLKKEDILEMSRKTALFEAIQKGQLEGAPEDLDSQSASFLLRAMIAEKTGPEEWDLKALAEKYSRGSRLFDFGGMFITQLYEEREGNLTPFYKMRENLQKTMDLTTSSDGVGDDYQEKGELLMALTFNAFGSPDDIPDEDAAEGADHGNERNTIFEYRKTWFHRLVDGMGRAYMFYHAGNKYIYDEWWTGSLKILNNPLKRGPKERAIRRIGYIRQAGGKTVAKIEDTQFLLKLFGTYNRQISIYRPDLADDDHFCALLICLSQFLTHQQDYRELRLQQSLPSSVGYNGGDMDASEQ